MFHIILVLISLIPMATGSYVESALFYHPDRHLAKAPGAYEDVWFETPDHLRLHGWFMPAEHRPGEMGPFPTVLHVHGNSGQVGNHRFVVDYLPAHGFNVLLFDYRGFGASETHSMLFRRSDLVVDTQAAIDYLRSRRDVDVDRLAIFGYSLGAAIGLDTAARRTDIRSVIEFAGFASWAGVAADHAGWLGWWLINPGYDPVDAVAQLGNRPLLIVHGRRDGIVPYRHGKLLYQAARAAGVPVTMLTRNKANHIALGSDPVVREAVIEFLNRTLGSDSPRQRKH